MHYQIRYLSIQFAMAQIKISIFSLISALHLIDASLIKLFSCEKDANKRPILVDVPPPPLGMNKFVYIFSILQ